MPKCLAAAGGLGRQQPRVSFSITRNGRSRSSLNPSGSHALPSPIGSSPHSSRPAVTTPGDFGATPAGPGVNVSAPDVPPIGSQNPTAVGGGGGTTEPRICSLIPPLALSAGTKPVAGAARPNGR